MKSEHIRMIIIIMATLYDNRLQAIRSIQIRSIYLLANFKKAIEIAEHNVKKAEQEAQVAAGLADTIENKLRHVRNVCRSLRLITN